MAWAGAALSTPAAVAESLTLTPSSTEGPFYPDRLPLDTDNDLLIINDATTPAAGQVTHLGGRVLDSRGEPLRNAVVEIWQVDGHGVYLHTGSAGERRDANFQGYGRFLTGPDGQYYFRTVRPVRYPGRTPHIHFAVNRDGKRLLTTQMYIEGEPGNQRDGLYRSIRDERQRESVTVDFQKLPGSSADEFVAKFDIVLGLTPADEAS
ncbi:MAG TPA: protocatechuate 3,4-dioxygenase [Lacipirellulaceae bacterium]|nr:protocatechuate 3,4-dioxygenase [Lacipirellulaceae bacterium]